MNNQQEEIELQKLIYEIGTTEAYKFFETIKHNSQYQLYYTNSEYIIKMLKEHRLNLA